MQLLTIRQPMMRLLTMRLLMILLMLASPALDGEQKHKWPAQQVRLW